MTPVSPVIPGDFPEVVFAADQPQYIPLPAVCVERADGPVITRWRPTTAERQWIAEGADIVLQQLTFGGPLQPVNMQVCAQDEKPILVEMP